MQSFSSPEGKIIYSQFGIDEPNQTTSQDDPHAFICHQNAILEKEKLERHDLLLQHVNTKLKSKAKKPLTLDDLKVIMRQDIRHVAEEFQWIHNDFYSTTISDVIKNDPESPLAQLFKRIAYGNATGNKDDQQICKPRDRSMQPFPLHPVNYIFTTDEHTGGCELNGKRPLQEDRIATGSIFTSGELNWKNILSNIVATMAEIIKPMKEAGSQGSCFMTNVITRNKIYTANLGDSTTFLVTVNEDGSISCKRLNSLHNPDNVKEYLATYNRGGYIFEGRVNNVLAITRSLGDLNLTDDKKRPVVSSSPELIVTDIPAKGKSFLITACDGMTETNAKTKKPAVDEAFIRTVFDYYKHTAKSSNAIAKKLAMKAYENGSQDNISVIVTKLNDLPANKVLYASVFDGHGGDAISERIYQNFTPLLKQYAHSELMQNLLGDLKELQADNKHLGIRNIAVLANKPIPLIDMIILECKHHNANFTSQMKHSIFHNLADRSDAADLLYRAIANLETTDAIFPGVTNLRQLMIARQKYEALEMIKSEVKRLSANSGHYVYNYNANVTEDVKKALAKIKGYLKLYNYIFISHPDEELSEVSQAALGMNDNELKNILSLKRGAASVTSSKKIDKLVHAPTVTSMFEELGLKTKAQENKSIRNDRDSF